MKPAWIRLEKARERLAAARAWHADGLLDSAGLIEVREARPLLREPIGWIWRLLVFFFALVSLSGILGTIALTLEDVFRTATGSGTVLLLFAGGCLLLAELISGGDGPGLMGADAACSLLAAVCAAIGLGLLLHGAGFDEDLVVRWMPLLAGTLLGLAAWRYGYFLYAAGAAACFFLQMTVFDQGRILWVAGGAAIAAGSWRCRETPESPSHRAGLLAVLAVSLGAVYAAVNLYSVDCLEFGDFLDLRHAAPAVTGFFPGRWAAALATALMPAGVLAWALRGRSRLLLSLGILFGALSLVTLRFYVHVAPLEFILMLSGMALVAGSLMLVRWLAAGPGGERHGFTHAPLFDDARREQFLAVAAVVAATPEARRLPDQDGFRGQGGDFGGGGASSTF